MPREWTDLGHGVRYHAIYVLGDDGTRTQVGIMVDHPGKGPEGRCWCSCRWVRDSTGEPHHELVSLDPLTISPSLGCPECGLHGFIRDGQWIPA